MPPSLELPSYLAQSPDVSKRFEKLRNRPVKLKVENLSKKFDTPNGEILALNKINFQIFRREFISVIGPSGCGKTTLIRILAGLDFPTSGNVFLEGRKMEGPGAERGMVFQDYTLFPWLSVKKNVMFGLEIKGLGKLKAEVEAKEWLDIVGLAKFADAYPEQLSGGMKQRVAIARSLANRPEILFLDEPFGALDAQTRSSMQAYLLKIWQNVDVTVFFVTHDLDEAIYLSDRILVLRANPGEIDELIEVPVPRPRAPGQFLTPEFLATKKRLEELIRPPELAQNDEFPMVRLTEVGDEVE